jgi:hypothetical protein
VDEWLRTAKTKYGIRFAEAGLDVVYDEESRKAIHRSEGRSDLSFNEEQVLLNTKAPMCGVFAEPSDGLGPLTPSL